MVIGEFERKLLKNAAIKLVDSMREFGPHVILLCGTSSQPAFSLIAEAWRRRHPKTPLPGVCPVSIARREHIEGQKVVLFDEIFSSGNSLEKAERIIARFNPAQIKKVALTHYPQVHPPQEVETGGASGGLLSLGDIGWGTRRELPRLRVKNKEKARNAARRIRYIREELRQIAREIKPRE
ncbi:MAG: phosphoribosyltransferase family protein [Candidatus Micrarchaeota archaeon]